MKKLLFLTLLSGLLLAVTGCVEEVEYTNRPHVRASHYNDRYTTTSYRSRPVYRDNRSVYRSDRVVYRDDRPVYRGERSVYRDDPSAFRSGNYYDDDDRDVRVYNAPTVRRTQVRVGY